MKKLWNHYYLTSELEATCLLPCAETYSNIYPMLLLNRVLLKQHINIICSAFGKLFQLTIKYLNMNFLDVFLYFHLEKV